MERLGRPRLQLTAPGTLAVAGRRHWDEHQGGRGVTRGSEMRLKWGRVQVHWRRLAFVGSGPATLPSLNEDSLASLVWRSTDLDDR